GRATVRIEIDGVEVVAWAGPAADLTASKTWFTRDRTQVGLGVWENCRYRFEAAEFRPLSGTADYWGPARPATAEKPGLVRRFGRYKGAVVQLALAPDGS